MTTQGPAAAAAATPQELKVGLRKTEGAHQSLQLPSTDLLPRPLLKDQLHQFPHAAMRLDRVAQGLIQI